MAGESDVVVIPDEGPAVVVTPVAPVVTPPVVVAPVEPVAPEAPAQPDWRIRRIGELTATARERQERIAALEADLAAARATRAQPVDPAAPPVVQQPQFQQPVYTEAQVTARAAELAARQTFDAQCEASYKAGTTKYPDFHSRVETFKHLGGITNDALKAALATGASHDVLYALAGNPDEAARVMAMEPMQMAVEMAKIAAVASKPVPVAPVSAVPAPIEPIESGQRTPDGLTDEVDDSTWFERRRAQLKARKA